MSDEKKPKMDQAEYTKVVAEMSAYVKKTIHDQLKNTLIAPDLSDEIRASIIETVRQHLEKNGAKWEVTMEANRVVVFPINDAAVDLFYQGEKAEVMRVYLKNWRELKRMMGEPVP